MSAVHAVYVYDFNAQERGRGGEWAQWGGGGGGRGGGLGGGVNGRNGGVPLSTLAQWQAVGWRWRCVWGEGRGGGAVGRVPLKVDVALGAVAGGGLAVALRVGGGEGGRSGAGTSQSGCRTWRSGRQWAGGGAACGGRGGGRGGGGGYLSKWMSHLAQWQAVGWRWRCVWGEGRGWDAVGRVPLKVDVALGAVAGGGLAVALCVGGGEGAQWGGYLSKWMSHLAQWQAVGWRWRCVWGEGRGGRSGAGTSQSGCRTWRSGRRWAGGGAVCGGRGGGAVGRVPLKVDVALGAVAGGGLAVALRVHPELCATRRLVVALAARQPQPVVGALHVPLHALLRGRAVVAPVARVKLLTCDAHRRPSSLMRLISPKNN